MKDFFLQVLELRLSPPNWEWLQQAASGGKSSQVLANYTGASRLGKAALRLNSSEQERLRHLHPRLIVSNWGLDEAARAVILLAVAGSDPERFPEVALQCYELGDSREQESWLRGLSVLPEGHYFLATAIDSCRTNIIPIFEAIACENPYPSVHFPELNFNQMVLKCLFNRIALSRIIGLQSRLNAELSRMADHYGRELTAAGRPVPNDIDLARSHSHFPEANA